MNTSTTTPTTEETTYHAVWLLDDGTPVKGAITDKASAFQEVAFLKSQGKEFAWVEDDQSNKVKK